jgi:ribosomal protein S18 acetylase RimI-like enzyme
MRYSNSAEGVTANDLEGFFEGWPNPPSPARHLELLRGSSHVVVARADEAGPVVGFVTALSDGVLAAYIPLLEVTPTHRSRGVGSELVRRLLAELADLYMIDVMCDADVLPFYERLGFTAAGGGIIRNYSAAALVG